MYKKSSFSEFLEMMITTFLPHNNSVSLSKDLGKMLYSENLPSLFSNLPFLCLCHFLFINYAALPPQRVILTMFYSDFFLGTHQIRYSLLRANRICLVGP